MTRVRTARILAVGICIIAFWLADSDIAQAQQLLASARVFEGSAEGPGTPGPIRIAFGADCRFGPPAPSSVEDSCSVGVFFGQTFTSADSGNTFYSDVNSDRNFQQLRSYLTNGIPDTVALMLDPPGKSMSGTFGQESRYFDAVGPDGIDFRGLTVSRVALRLERLSITPTSANSIRTSFRIALWLEGNRTRTIETCDAPRSLSVDQTESLGFLVGSITDVRSDAFGDLRGKLTLQNYLPFWLSVSVSPSAEALAFNTDPGSAAGFWARIGVIPPCSFDARHFECADPGVATWTVGACAGGQIRLSAAITLRSVALGLVDQAADALSNAFAATMSFDEYVALVKDLERVPAIEECATCLGASNSLTERLNCSWDVLKALLGNREQQNEIRQAFANHSVPLSGSDVVSVIRKWLFGTVELAGNMIAFDIRTIRAGHTGFLKMTIDGTR